MKTDPRFHSPIERSMYTALVKAAPRFKLHMVDYEVDDADDAIEDVAVCEIDVHFMALTYEVDLMLYDLGDFRLAIECDGHDFHDRTKQQAAYDRSRDRELLLAGIQTVRFTGSEIHHDANRCANEALAIFVKMSRRAWKLLRAGVEDGTYNKDVD